MKKYIGCDLGGTNLRAGIVDVQTGEISRLKTVPTLAREGHNAVMERIAQLIEEIILENGYTKNEIGGIGIGVPGLLDLDRGLVLFLPNLPGTWPNVPLVETIQMKTDLPVSILNDVRAITFGEWKFGAGQGVSTMACFAIGTGVGGGLVINDQLHLGISGAAAELGHQIIDFNGPLCGCGSRGCLETFASGPAIAAMGMKAVAQGLTTRLSSMVDYDLNRITPKVIAQAALEGDEVAQEIYQDTGFYLGIGISNILTTLNPKKVVLAGGVAQAGELLLAPIRKTIRERVKLMPVDQVEVLTAQLGNNAGAIGVATWAAQRSAF